MIISKSQVKWVKTPFGEEEECPHCGSSVSWVDCENCDDGFSGHECGEDCCCCLDPEPNVVCYICNGDGGWYVCHSEACNKELEIPRKEEAKTNDSA